MHRRNSEVAQRQLTSTFLLLTPSFPCLSPLRSPPPAAQAFGGAVAFLLERYRPLRDRKTLKELVIKVLKPAIRLFLNRCVADFNIRQVIL